MYIDVVGGLAAIILGYFLGSLSFAHLTARYFGRAGAEELRHGGAGASTMYRILGPRAGVLVAVGDFSKSALAVVLAQKLVSPHMGMLAGAAAVAGHNWPVFYGFRGGRGAAAAAGALLALVPLALAAGLAVATVTFLLTRNVLVASVALFLPAVPLAWALAYPVLAVVYTALLPGTVAAYTWLAGRHVSPGERWRTTFMRR